jgi:D-alanyl-D-alanine endopeptidase (penicillin-binding protein 7)
MQVLLLAQLVVLVFIPLLAPRAAAAPSTADSFATAAALHHIATTPHTQLEAFASLPIAADRPLPVLPVRKDGRDLGPAVAATSAIVLDEKTGAVLFTKDADRSHAVASLSKLLTALVVADTAPDWQAVITIVPEDLRGGGIEYFLVGDRVTVKDLLYASLVASSNTATVALARSTGLTPDVFAARMNEQAAALGAIGASFVEPTGLSNQNHGSAKDVARIAHAAFFVPQIVDAASRESYALTVATSRGNRTRLVKSTDLLLKSILNAKPYRITGGKTGTLGEETGFHVALSVTDKEKNQTILVVVLGSDTQSGRFQDAKQLALWAFGAYDWPVE